MLLGGCSFPSVREAAHLHSPKPPSHPQMGSCLSASFCFQLCGMLWRAQGQPRWIHRCRVACPALGHIPVVDSPACVTAKEGLRMSQLSWVDAGDKRLSPYVYQSNARLSCPPTLGIQQNNNPTWSLLASSSLTSAAAGDFPSQ